MRSVLSYRAAGRVALELWLANPDDAQPWTAEGAALTSKAGDALRVLRVWQLEPIPPGDMRTVVVEAEEVAPASRGPFILKLWEAGGKRAVTLGNVTFP